MAATAFVPRRVLMSVRMPFYPAARPWTSGAVRVPVEDAPAYVAALGREVESSAPVYASCRVPALWLGGGSAGGVADEAVADLLALVARTYDLHGEEGFPAEVALEVHPCWVTPTGLEAAVRAGVTRFVVDLGTASASEARELDCCTDPVALGEGLVLLADSTCDVAIKLFAGIPGQSVRSGIESVEAAVVLGACEVDVRPFLLDPDAPLAAKRVRHDDAWRQQPIHRLPTTTERAEISAAMGEHLAREGFVEYLPGVWAIPGHESTYHWLRSAGCDVAGFGLGARTRFGGVASGNTRDLATYLAVPDDPAQRVVERYRAVE